MTSSTRRQAHQHDIMLALLCNVPPAYPKSQKVLGSFRYNRAPGALQACQRNDILLHGSGLSQNERSAADNVQCELHVALETKDAV